MRFCVFIFNFCLYLKEINRTCSFYGPVDFFFFFSSFIVLFRKKKADYESVLFQIKMYYLLQVTLCKPCLLLFLLLLFMYKFGFLVTFFFSNPVCVLADYVTIYVQSMYFLDYFYHSIIYCFLSIKY